MSNLGYLGKKVFVYGLGKSGHATAAALYADGAEVYMYDAAGLDAVLQNPASKRLLDKNTVYFADEGVVNWAEIDAVFKSPGIPMEDEIIQNAIAANIPVLGDVDLLYKREPKAKFVGITGTNGKSTTTSLIGHILETAGKDVAVGGNLGTACMNLEKGKDIYVLELSSYQLEIMNEAKMDVAVLLNLTPDHLARHGDMKNYLAVKSKIFNHDDGAINVIGVDNPETENVKLSGTSYRVSVDGKPADVQVDDNGALTSGGEEVLNLNDYPHLPGKHNWQNIACAYGALKEVVYIDTFKKGLETFKNLPHRMERVGEYAGVTFYNDSKATNPDSAIRALESVEHIFWICGGMTKDEGMEPCLTHVANVESAFVIGKDRKPVLGELEGHVKAFDCTSMEDAVFKAWQEFQLSGLKQATILLSPACASWDQFDSFEHRGDVFVNACHSLIQRMKDVSNG